MEKLSPDQVHLVHWDLLEWTVEIFYIPDIFWISGWNVELIISFFASSLALIGVLSTCFDVVRGHELFLAAGAYNHKKNKKNNVYYQDTVTRADVWVMHVDLPQIWGMVMWLEYWEAVQSRVDLLILYTFTTIIMPARDSSSDSESDLNSTEPHKHTQKSNKTHFAKRRRRE